MKLSIIIPAFNEELRLGKCLDSIFAALKNTPRNVEIVVVNNASTDNTKEVAVKYPGVIVVDETRKGLTFARRAGQEVSTGDLIANIDADNLISESWVHKVFAEFEENKKLVALSGPVYFYDMSKFQNFLVSIFFWIGYAMYLVSHFVLRRAGMLQGGNFIVRRAALEKIGGYDTTIKFYGEDTDLARRLQKEGDIKFTFELRIASSGRRLLREGILVMGLRYALNYLSIVFLKKPYTEDAIDHR